MNENVNAPWSALPVLLAGAFMVVLDFFIVNVALPSIGTGLRASSSALEWIVAAYGLSFAALLIIAGRLGDEVGRRRVYLIGLALFVASSAACSFAPNAQTLVLARALQGAAGGILAPQILAIIGVTFRGEGYTRALSIYGIVLGLAAIGGQVIGGALVQLDLAGLGWRACFLINVPIGIAALVLAPRLVPETRSPSRRRLDVLGAAILGGALVAILLPLIEGRQHGWPLWTWLSLAAADLALVRFVLRQRRLLRRGDAPLLDLTLFRRRSFSAGLVAHLCLACAQASFFVYLALYLQQGRGMSALDAGLVFTVLAVAYVVTSGPAPALTARYGRAVVIAGGLSLGIGLCALAFAVAAVGVGGSILALVPGLLFVGAGIGLCYTPLTSTVMADIDARRAGSATGALTTTQQVGYALGVALTGLVFFGQADVGYAFELSLFQVATFAVALVGAALMLPRPRGPELATGARTRPSTRALAGSAGSHRGFAGASRVQGGPPTSGAPARSAS